MSGRTARQRSVDALASALAAARPSEGDVAGDGVDRLAAAIAGDSALRDRIVGAIAFLRGEVRAVDTLASAGILGDASLLGELEHRVWRRLLPAPPDPTSLDDLLDALLAPDDAAWLADVPSAAWDRLLDALGLRIDADMPIPAELDQAIRVLAHRVGALGLRPVLTTRVPEFGLADSPFLVLSDQVLAYVRSHGNGCVGDEPPLLAACMQTLRGCRDAVDRLRANKHRYGTSLELTALSFRLLGMVDRLERLLELTDPDPRRHGPALGRLVADLARARSEKDHLLPLLRRHADLLATQVVEHAARKGRRYITETPEEYRRFLVSSLGGGFIVAVFALFKVLLGEVPLPLAGQALVYGLNYAACFVLIYLSGATLATKQPALTAQTLAASLDGPVGERRTDGLAELTTRAFRSQFISFVGNLAMAFPVGLGLAAGWRLATGGPLVDPAKAAALAADVHPWQGAALWYAAIAGVLLFGAGVVSGWVDNRFVYSRVQDRIAHHPALVRLLGVERAGRIAVVTEAKAGALVGNVALGFGLGSAGVFGHILGLPIDIRHIAFSSAQLAFGLEGAGAIAPAVPVLFAGVALIGFVNFLVSFGLALWLAAESRGLEWREARSLVALLGARLRTRPSEFFVPPRPRGSDSGPDDLVATASAGGGSGA